MFNKKILALMAVVLFLAVSVVVVEANNKWKKYHWNLSTEDSTVNPLKLGDNLTSLAWDSSLAGASFDWNDSVLKNQVVAGTNTACDPVLGGVEICNDSYGDNNWLGIAQIWVYRGKGSHIAQALVKVNDTYFNTPQYDTQSWRNFVMCQEVGHTFGLDHQDENFSNANLGTCMDYTNDPDGTIFNQLDNQHPNLHDYDTMTEIYAHLNGTDDGGNEGGKPDKCSPWPSCKNNQGKGNLGISANINLNDPSAWGQAIRQDARGNNSLFERNLGNGLVLITYVIWVE